MFSLPLWLINSVHDFPWRCDANAQSVTRLRSVHSKSAQRTVQCTPARRRDILIHRNTRGPTGTGHPSQSSIAVPARTTRSCLLDTTPLSVPPRTLHPAIATVRAIRQPAVPTRQSELSVSTFTLVLFSVCTLIRSVMSHNC